MDELAKEMGFVDFKEMSRLTSRLDISTPEKLKAFNDWKMNDGTKNGLLELYTQFGQEPPK